MSVENRKAFLETVDGLVNGDRNVQYGEPSDDFECTAAMLSAFLGMEIKVWQVPAIQVIVKLSRIRKSPEKLDHWLDLAGYATTGGDVTEPLRESVRDASGA